MRLVLKEDVKPEEIGKVEFYKEYNGDISIAINGKVVAYFELDSDIFKVYEKALKGFGQGLEIYKDL